MTDSIDVASVIRFLLWMQLLDRIDLAATIVHVLFDLVSDLQNTVQVFLGKKTAVEQVQDFITHLVKRKPPTDEDAEYGLICIAMRFKVLSDGSCAQFADRQHIVQATINDWGKTGGKRNLSINRHDGPPNLPSDMNIHWRKMSECGGLLVQTCQMKLSMGYERECDAQDVPSI